MGVLITNTKFQAIDSSGAPLSSGKLYTYYPGGTTSKKTYSDRACSSANANPVVLDSRGEATIYGTGLYKLVLKDSADTTIWTMDNVEFVGGGGSYILYPDPGEVNQSATGNGSSLYALLTALGTSKKATVKFTHNGGSNTTSYAFTTDYNASGYKNVTFEFERGAVLTISTTKTLTLPSPAHILASSTEQIFSITGTGKVAFNTPGIMYPDWWTTNATPGTTEMYSALNAAEAACSTGGVIKLNGATYLMSTSLTLGSDIVLDMTISTAKISVAATKTLTVYSLKHILTAGQSVFAGTGSVATTASGLSIVGTSADDWLPLKDTTGLYDFSVSGGSTGDYTLGALPDNATITTAWYEVLTQPTSGGAATIALGIATNAATGLLGATAYDNAAFSAGYHDCTPTGASANFTTKTTAARNVVLTVGGAALTAGKIRVHWQYIVSE